VSERILLLLTFLVVCNILPKSGQSGTKCQGSIENLFVETMLVQTVREKFYLLYDRVCQAMLAVALISEAEVSRRNSVLGKYQRWIAEESSRE
jgi:hypothetical protein